MHLASIRTADFFSEIAFYVLLGFSLQERFTAGITLACWMTGLNGRIELLQVPEPGPTPDAFYDENYTGYYHLSFDLTQQTASLPQWIEQLRRRFATMSQQQPDQINPLKVLLPPQQQMIGDRVYEVAFIADADGLPLEFIRQLDLPQDAQP